MTHICSMSVLRNGGGYRIVHAELPDGIPIKAVKPVILDVGKVALVVVIGGCCSDHCQRRAFEMVSQVSNQYGCCMN